MAARVLIAFSLLLATPGLTFRQAHAPDIFFNPTQFDLPGWPPDARRQVAEVRLWRVPK